MSRDIDDRQYKALLDDAFEAHIRPRLRCTGGEPPSREWLEREIVNLRRAVLIATHLGNACNAQAEASTVFQVKALQQAEAKIAETLRRTQSDLDALGFLDAIGAFPEVMIAGAKVAHIPEADFAFLRELGRSDPERDCALALAYLQTGAWRSDPAPGGLSPRKRLGEAAATLEAQMQQPPPVRQTRRWWKGLGQIGIGSATSLFNGGLAASLFAFPISPETQTVGAITSVLSGFGMIMQGVGEFKGE